MPVLTPDQGRFLAAARRAVLVTVAPDGTPRPVPVCFVLTDDGAEGQPAEAEGQPAEAETRTADGSAPEGWAPEGSGVVAWIPLDEKPKSVSDPRDLARVRDIVDRPRVALLVDRWSEDWAALAWFRCMGTARVIEPAQLPPARHAAILAALREKHPQYRDHALETRPLIAVIIERAAAWGRLDD